MELGAFRRILEVSSGDPDDARRRQLLNILILGLAVLSLLTILITGAVTASQMRHPDPAVLMAFLLSLAALAAIVMVFVINYLWSGRIASALFVVMLTVIITMADEPSEVVNGRSVFLFTIPILMASVLVRPWAAFAAAGLSSAVVTIMALRLPGYIPPAPTMLGFCAFALISWLSARSLEDALNELRAMNRELDQRVENRTQELREANEELARANDRLRELDRLKSRFVSMVSHELRTPLGAIQGFAEMLRAGIYGTLSDKQDNALHRIERNTHRLLNIVNDLLDQARIEAGELSIHPEPFAPEALVEDLETTVGVLAEQKGLDMTIAIEDDLPRPLYGDRDRLHQVLVNLTNNAIKFTDTGGIQIRVGRADGDHPSHWAMEVSDTGPGISEKDQDMIFTPFRRVDDSITREHMGVGLGLSIVKQLVELMDGEVTLESKLGEGSTFAVILPFGHPQRRDS